MATNNHSFLRRLVPSLERQGWKVRWGRTHVMLYPADKTKQPFSVAGSPSDMHGRKHAIRDIRRAGGLIEYEG